MVTMSPVWPGHRRQSRRGAAPRQGAPLPPDPQEDEGGRGHFPRQINNIATACLINAATKELQKVSADLVNETMDEFRLPQPARP